MLVWCFNSASGVDDLAAFWEIGEHEYVAYMLVSAGAVEPNCKEAKELIKVSNSISEKEKDKIVKRLNSEGYITVVCKSCNHHHFIPPYCNASDWLNGSCDGCTSKNTVVTEKEYYEQ